MKRTFLLCGLVILGILSCSKSSDEVNNPDNDISKNSQAQDFALNNLKLSATTVRGWLSKESIQNVVFVFFSKDLTNIGSNMTLSAYTYEKNNTTMPGPVFLEISSKSPLQLESNITLPNNQVPIAKIRRMVSNEAGIIDFDYLLFEPKYYMLQSDRYISYNITPYKNGEPVTNPSSLVSDGDGGTNPCPPFRPGD